MSSYIIPHCILCFQSDYGDQKETLFFRDKRRRIDFVLAYKEGKDEDGKHQARRETFENNLKEEGLELEYEDKKVSRDR